MFHETYKAYKYGRINTDPTQGWYEGEKGFFDFYIIPLAKKLSKCGVFGVSSDEFLNYAQANRKEWEVKGQEMVQMYLQTYEQKYGKVANDLVEEEEPFDFAEDCQSQEVVDEMLEDVRGRLIDRLRASDHDLDVAEQKVF